MMQTSSIASGGCTSTSGPMGGAMPPLGPPYVGSPIGTPMYLSLPLCLDSSGHRFAIGMYHKDRAVCDRCGLIRKQVA